MPTYEYACTACGHRFDAVQRFTDEPLTECPQCAGALRKVYGAVGIVLKGSGFYKTDSRAAAGANGSNGSGSKRSEPAASDASGSNGSDSGSGSGNSADPGSTSSSSGPSDKKDSSKSTTPASSTAD